MSDDVRPTRRSAPLLRYSPSALVVHVQQLLLAEGISVLIDLGSASTAINAAADLLRAIGVTPGQPYRG